jgi:acyl-CoA thioesterase FadM
MSLLFRFFLNIFYNLLFKPRMDLKDTARLSFRVLPHDLDLNIHMNNGRYLTIMDIGRIDLTAKTGLLEVMLKKKWGGVATAVNINFFRALGPFQKYELHTRLLWWDESWFYLEQKFMSKNKICAKAIVRVTFTNKKGRIPTKETLEAVGRSFNESPEAPVYLKELIKGEEHLIAEIKKINKGETTHNTQLES